MPVRTLPTRPAVGDTLDQVVEFYYRYLARNRDLAVHFGQFKKRLKADPQAATAEAIVFSHLRAESLHPEAAFPFSPAWMPTVPFVQFDGLCTPNHIATQWIETDSGERVATLPHRRVQYFS